MRPVLTGLLLLAITTPTAVAQPTPIGAPPSRSAAQTPHGAAAHTQAATNGAHAQMAGRAARIGDAQARPVTGQAPPAPQPQSPTATGAPYPPGYTPGAAATQPQTQPQAQPSLTAQPVHTASPASLIVHQPGTARQASHEIALKPPAAAAAPAAVAGDVALPLAKAGAGDIPLAPPSGDKSGGSYKPGTGSGPAITSMLGSLVVVIGLFLAVAWFARRAGGKSATALPKEVVQVLGRTPLTAKQNLQVIRFGNKMLLVSVSAGGAETLAELTDGPEVDRIAGLCQQQGSESITASFKQMMTQMSREPVTRTEAASPTPAPATRAQPAPRPANSRAAAAYNSTGR